ncbi:ThiF family adenylyltransferase [Acidiferrobacter thiooxydans]|jgi:molybdopterin/thiamine biosynthesis adenylyltransferase|nr:ThiF family adenylyltransferase [Acidiferrobacter thiooxydans]
MAKRVLSPTQLDNEFFKERVNRTQTFLGECIATQHSSQIKLRQSTVGIAGAGGIGGAIALRLCRLGVGALKIADPDVFEISNINRQIGASYDNIGKNKASTVGQMAFDIAKDTRIEVYEDGISHKNAAEFVAGCDLVLDQLDFSVIDEKFALHDAFHESEVTHTILACSVIGWSAHLYKFTRQSMHIRKWYDPVDHSNIV